jgi:homopolymeric O-antigen transport system ATP-binding protein
MSELAIRAEGLSKRYVRGAEPRGKLIEWLRRRVRKDYFWALDDVTFDVKKGEMLGIIGLNGAGKSTLLKLLSRITRPNRGRAEIHGRVGSLLDVGTGFHPELTGRENIYLNGALIGIGRAEIHSKFDEIVSFSGIGEFLDTPLKRYSAGMKVRLGFSVSVNLHQEIMLVDEVLAVGDAAFRDRCLERMELVTKAGRTVVFVGHNLPMIAASCDRALWLEKGKIREEGAAGEIVHSYEDAVLEEKSKKNGFLELPPADGQEAERVVLTHVRLLNGTDEPVPYLTTGQRTRIAVGYRVAPGARPAEVRVALTLLSRSQNPVASCESACVGADFDPLPARGEFICEMDRLPLMPGSYRLGLRCTEGDRVVHNLPMAGTVRVVEGAFYPTGRLPRAGAGSALLDYRWSVVEERKP